PLLSYPSAILGREKAIVLNLEHIKAIITSEEVLLRDPLDDNVIPIVEELQRRLPPVNVYTGQGDDEEGTEVQTDAQTNESNEFPFEFRALEVALEGICSFLDARTRELETAAYPALDELTSMVRDELEQLLDDDDDMADLYLSRKLSFASS
ncbi:magnesium transporter MRS2-I, partial [Tanacetum coccineum]